LNKKYLIISIAALIGAATPIIYFSTNHAGSGLHQFIAQSSMPVIHPATSFGWTAVVSDFAGSGEPGAINGQKSEARFSDPYGLVTDRHGNVYIADAGENNQIRKITPDGIVTTFAGKAEGYADGTASEAEFNTPSGLAIDADDNLYVADTGNNVIRKISKTGVVSTLAGTGRAGFADGAALQAQFNGPTGVAADSHGNIYVADTYNDRIRMISASGIVTTVAGTGVPGYLDGQSGEARFDTPCAVAINSKDDLIVADTKNNALRVITKAGQVTTLYRSLPEEHDAEFRRPISLAVTPDDFVYVGTMKSGRIFQFLADGTVRILTDAEADLSVPRQLEVPYGMTLTDHGELLVTDAPAFKVRKLAPVSAGQVTASTQPARSVVPSTLNEFPWPVQPQHGPHEIVGTIGEDRGNDKGESRDHFHAGVDVRANMGTTVVAVASGKVSDPLAAWGYGNLSEGLSIGVMNYIHMRVGRNEKNELIDPARFIVISDDQKKSRVRVKRGTRFATGDALGTINRMFHVHLEYSPFGEQVNPLVLGLQGYVDTIAPHIESIGLVDQQGKTLSKKNQKRLLVDRTIGNLGIVVGAYDQSNGNETRRRLGLYKVGYQILRADGRPLPGFESPLMNIEFNQVASDNAIKIAYAAGSGETVHGNKVTVFLYVVTNKVRDGVAQEGFWNPAALPHGDYLIRIYAADFAGNVAVSGRDLPISVE